MPLLIVMQISGFANSTNGNCSVKMLADATPELAEMKGSRAGFNRAQQGILAKRFN